MLKDPAADPEILESLNELRLWLDGFLCDREVDDTVGEIWPRAITGHHLDSLETVLAYFKEVQNNNQALDEISQSLEKEIKDYD